MINNALNNSLNKIDARKCKLVFDIDCHSFLKENHIQGDTNYTTSIGLLYNNELVSVMTFIKSRNKYDWELNRFCSVLNTNVRGSFNKLLKYRPKGIIVSYSDCRYSNGNIYKISGFNLITKSNPQYYYTKDYGCLLSRMNFQKSKLKKKFNEYNEAETEWENMKRFEVPQIDFSLATNFSSAFTSLRSLKRFKAINIKVNFALNGLPLSSEALNEVFSNLPIISGKTINISNCLRASTCNKSIATAKGWTVVG